MSKNRFIGRCCLALLGGLGLAVSAAQAQPANGTCSLSLPAQWAFPGTGGTINQTAIELTGWTFSGAACAGATGGVVYYNFTPASAGPWRFSTCASTPTFDTVLSIHTGCPASATNYATGSAATSCNDTGTGCTGDASTFDAPALTVGTPYVIRLARWNSLVVPAGGVRVDVTNLGITGACCAAAGTCTITTGAACTSGSAFQGPNTLCSPNPCPQPPANDLCAGAQVIPATALPVNASATGSLALAGPTTAITPAVCATSSRDVFYSFTPVDSAAYTITTCNSVSGTLDTVVSVHTACPADGSTLIAGLCNDDACTGGVGPSTVAAAPLSAGVTYIIRVARWSTGAGGPFRLDITTGSFGACCDVAAGTCQLQSQTACASPRVFQGDATTCSPNPCVGTCCNPTTGACTLTGSTACASPNVFTAGPGAVCTPNPCPQPPAPANDECTAAQVVTTGSPAFTGSTGGGTTGFDEVQSCVAGTVNGVWFAFTPATTGSYQIDTRGGPLDTVLSVTDGCGGIELACDDDAPGLFAAASEVQVNLTAGQSVRILVTNYSTFVASGTFPLNIFSITVGACCNITSGACTISTSGAAGCAPGLTYQDGVTSCVPNPCPQPPPPSNDECPGTVVTIGTPVAGLISAATGSDVTTCSGTNVDVWFVFTPAASGFYSVTATPTLITDDALALAAFDTCPAALDANQPGIACVAQPFPGDPTTITVTGTAGAPLYIRAGAFLGDVGTFSLSINPVTAGACCNNTTGACSISTTGAAGCGTFATYQGDNSVCSPSPCPASGSCCNPASGGCTITVAAACASPSTWTSGDVCVPNPCPQPPPPANDECTGAIALQLNVAVTGANTQATGDGFEGPAGSCYFTSGTTFGKAVWFSFTAPASDVYGFTACGSAFDTVLSVFDGTCAAFGSELACDDDTCDGVTPVGSGLASVIAPIALTQGQTYLVRLAAWGTAPFGGTYTITATGTPVVSNVVCCRGVTCAVIAAVDCTAPAGVGIRTVTGTTCAGQSAINAGCCYADFNKSGVKDVADIFAFLSAWFANSPFSDVGGDGTGTRDVSDIFQFLSAWFVGCT